MRLNYRVAVFAFLAAHGCALQYRDRYTIFTHSVVVASSAAAVLAVEVAAATAAATVRPRVD